MTEKIEELCSDFSDIIEKINFKSYNPNSSEFIKALNVGLMWMILNELKGKDEIHHFDVGIVDRESKRREKDADEDNDILNELKGAKKYFQKYSDSHDSAFKEMANQELHHAEILIKKANAKLPTGEEKMKLKEYEVELKEISNKINE